MKDLGSSVAAVCDRRVYSSRLAARTIKPAVTDRRYRKPADIYFANHCYRTLEVAAGFEIRTDGANQLALLFVQLCPTVWAGAFDEFDVGGITGGGRHEVCRPVVPCQSNRRDVPKSLRRRRAGLQMW